MIFLTATLLQISPPRWKKAKEGFVDMPSPSQHGWVVEDTQIEPVWSEGPILRSRLVDILAGGQDVYSDDDYTSDDEPDFDIAFSSNNDDDDYNNWTFFHTA